MRAYILTICLVANSLCLASGLKTAEHFLAYPVSGNGSLSFFSEYHLHRSKFIDLGWRLNSMRLEREKPYRDTWDSDKNTWVRRRGRGFSGSHFAGGLGVVATMRQFSPVLLKCDLSSNYLFGLNRFSQNVGASAGYQLSDRVGVQARLGHTFFKHNPPFAYTDHYGVLHRSGRDGIGGPEISVSTSVKIGDSTPWRKVVNRALIPGGIPAAVLGVMLAYYVTMYSGIGT